MTTPEREYYLNTVKINRRGVPVDLEEITDIQARIDRYTKELSAELQKITGGGVQTANQRDKILDFLKTHCQLELPDLQKLTVENALEDPRKITGVARRVLEIRHTVGKASVKKYKSMIASLCPDGTIKNNLIYHKASTGRYAGVNTQFQNLAQQRKAVIKNPDFARKSFLSHSDAEIKFLWGGDISELAKDLIRAVIKCAPSFMFVCADFKGVEARGTAWACYEQDRIDVFNSGRDIYRVNAAGMYGLSYDDIPKNSDERQAGKINELLGGYQGGWRAIIKGAKKYKIDLGLTKAQQLIARETPYQIIEYCKQAYRYQAWCDCTVKDTNRKAAIISEKAQHFETQISAYPHSTFCDPVALNFDMREIGLDLARAKATEDNKAYRESRPKLVAAWENFNATAFKAMQNPGEIFQVPNVRPAYFQLRGSFLFMRLPSGREISYPFPEIRDIRASWGELKATITSMTVDKGKWVRRGMYGGKFFQNYIQGLCRDLLFHGQLLTEKAGYPWILSVHDEGLAMVPKDGGYSLEHFGELLTTKEPWAEGFPLEYDGWIGPRYHK